MLKHFDFTSLIGIIVLLHFRNICFMFFFYYIAVKVADLFFIDFSFSLKNVHRSLIPIRREFH